MDAANAVDRPLILAVDLGTGGPKTALVTPHGDVEFADHRRVDTIRPGPNGAEQDANYWWRCIEASLRLAFAEVDPRRVVGIGLTGQWGSTVPVGPDGVAVGPCLLWMDSRGGPLVNDAIGGPVAGFRPSRLATWIRLTGGIPSVEGADPLGHALFLARHRPETYAATRWLMEPVDFLALQFCGVAAATPASSILSWLTDNRPGAPTQWSPRLAALAGRDIDRLPSLRPTGTVIATVSDEIAAKFGLRPDVAVVTGIPDLHSAAMGVGAVRLGDRHLTISSTAWVSAVVAAKKTDIRRNMASVPGLGDGNYLVANNHDTAGLCLEWAAAALFDGDIGATLDAAAAAPPDSNGVMFGPWLSGQRCPIEDRRLRGSFIGLSLESTRSDIARAVLEGVAHNARWLSDAVDAFCGGPVASLRVLGGGTRSDLWCQIHADVLGRRLERVGDPLLTNVKGAAYFAGWKLGLVTLDDIVQAAQPDAVFEPNPAAAAMFSERHKVFLASFARLRRLYRRGHPAGRVAGTDSE